MTEKQRLLNTLNRCPTDRQPFIIPAGLIAIPLFSTTPERMYDASDIAEMACRVRWLTGAENLALPYTMRVLSGALGGEKDQLEESTPQVNYPLEGIDQWERLKPADPFKDRAVRATIHSIEILSRGHPQVPVVGDVPAPVSLAVGLVSAERVLLSAVKERETLCGFLSFLTDIIEEYASLLVRAGADVVFVKDEFSTLLGKGLFSSISLPHLKRLVEEIQKEVPVILHLCGDVLSVAEPVEKTGAVGLSVDGEVSVEELKRVFPRKVIMGNIHPQTETAEELAEQLKKLLSHRPHILAPSCGLTDRTSLARLAVVKSLFV